MPGRKGLPTPTGTCQVLYLSKYSAGCVHLSPAASLKFFNSLTKGDEVQVIPCVLLGLT
jgi:hypothetical protein